jgi:hypothetical protein
MTFVASITTDALSGLLSSPTGVASRLLGRLPEPGSQMPAFPPPEIVVGNIALDLWERALGGRFPQIVVYCVRVENLLVEKFRTFSGAAHLVIEVRNSQDRLEGLESRTHIYSEAVLEVLEDARGEWRTGVYYCGKYEVKFEPVRHGGKNFVQVAKIMVPVEVHIA